MERHGEESERLVGVSTSCWSSLLRRVARCESAAKLGCKKSARFGGGNVKDHGNKPIKLDSLLKSSFGRYVTPASRSHFTISNHRLRWAVGGMRFTAPLPVENGKSGGVRPFVQGGTHTGRRVRRFFKTPPTVEPVDETFLPRGGHTHTHTEPFSARSK